MKKVPDVKKTETRRKRPNPKKKEYEETED